MADLPTFHEHERCGVWCTLEHLDRKQERMTTHVCNLSGIWGEASLVWTRAFARRYNVG